MTIKADRLLLLSLKPRFASAILNGSKTVELRRRPPQIDAPTEALIYATSPVKALGGTCWVDDIIGMAPWTLWRAHGPATGVTRREFLEYFAGCEVAHALVLSRARPLAAPVELLEMRRTMGGLEPPQSFRYVEHSIRQALIGH